LPNGRNGSLEQWSSSSVALEAVIILPSMNFPGGLGILAREEGNWEKDRKA